jgi:regulator of RNase E activity RraA
VDAAGPGSIIVIAHNGRVDVAGWGGILSRGASRNAVEGVVIDGACRDLDESRQFGLTVFARAAVPRTARGRIVERAWNIPITVAGVAVSPGDLVIADASGVVFIPVDRAEEIVASAERIARREALMMAEVDRGRPMGAVMGADYEAMLDEDKGR